MLGRHEAMMQSTLTQQTVTQRHALPASIGAAQPDVVRSTSSRSADLDSLTEQANFLLQQIQAGMLQARMSYQPGHQQPGMQSQVAINSKDLTTVS